MLITFKNRMLLLLVVLVGFTTACKKKDKDEDPAPAESGYRTSKIDYSTLTNTTSYKTAFKNEAGDTTVDRDEGRNRLRMFRALATYISTSVSGGTVIDAAKLNDMFENKNSPFTGTFTDLNGLSINLKEVTASSKANQAAVHAHIADAFNVMSYISTQASNTAKKGTAGKAGTYLVDSSGVEWAQIIQKSLIGGFHLDYIGNVLLNTGLNADNKSLVAGKKYTALEHNWDLAYGALSLNDIYGSKEVIAQPNATPPVNASSGELYLGSYAWEYNKDGYLKLHMAFLKGRAAIHNNDMNEVRAQAAIIRGILEKAIGAAAEGYMYKAGVAASTEPVRIHAFGEGLGFIYSTRFCTLTGADDAFSDGLTDNLFVSETTTFYDITAAQFTAARNALIAKFNLVVVH